MNAASKPVLAISSCLLGNRVRYDGQNKGMAKIVRHMQKYFELLAICPEVEIGLSVPRPAVRLSGDPLKPSMTGRDHPGLDVTNPMRSFCQNRPRTLTHICGYIFKSRSPSCGLHDIPVFDISMPEPAPIIEHHARGLFADAILKHNPALPVIDETRLDSPDQRDNFVHQVFNYINQHPELFKAHTQL